MSLVDFFNWTMTYRLDSDVPRPYGWVEPTNRTSRSLPPRSCEKYKWRTYNEAEFARSLPNQTKEFKQLAKRPKLVAWIVSHCRTRSSRETYVKELQKHINVDVMGGCGMISCNKRYTR